LSGCFLLSCCIITETMMLPMLLLFEVSYGVRM
jgi:hypothetical protein